MQPLKLILFFTFALIFSFLVCGSTFEYAKIKRQNEERFGLQVIEINNDNNNVDVKRGVFSPSPSPDVTPSPTPIGSQAPSPAVRPPPNTCPSTPYQLGVYVALDASYVANYDSEEEAVDRVNDLFSDIATPFLTAFNVVPKAVHIEVFSEGGDNPLWSQNSSEITADNLRIAFAQWAQVNRSAFDHAHLFTGRFLELQEAGRASLASLCQVYSASWTHYLSNYYLERNALAFFLGRAFGAINDDTDSRCSTTCFCADYHIMSSNYHKEDIVGFSTCSQSFVCDHFSLVDISTCLTPLECEEGEVLDNCGNCGGSGTNVCGLCSTTGEPPCPANPCGDLFCSIGSENFASCPSDCGDWTDPRMSTVEGLTEGEDLPGNIRKNFTIISRNSQGERITTGGDRWVVVLDPASLERIEVVDNEDGSYSVSIVPVLRSINETVPLKITIESIGFGVSGSPFSVDVVPSGECPLAHAADINNICCLAVEIDNEGRCCRSSGTVVEGVCITCPNGSKPDILGLCCETKNQAGLCCAINNGEYLDQFGRCCVDTNVNPVTLACSDCRLGCSNNGLCDQTTKTCICNQDFSGTGCEINRCDNFTCQSGVCRVNNGVPTCVSNCEQLTCPAGQICIENTVLGPVCQTACAEENCPFGQVCRELNGVPQCVYENCLFADEADFCNFDEVCVEIAGVPFCVPTRSCERVRCQTHISCPAGYRCEDLFLRSGVKYVCVPETDCSRVACPLNYSCVTVLGAASCVPSSLVSSCEDIACPSNTECAAVSGSHNSFECVAKPSCDNVDCAGNTVCNVIDGEAHCIVDECDPCDCDPCDPCNCDPCDPCNCDPCDPCDECEPCKPSGCRSVKVDFGGKDLCIGRN